MGDQVHDFEPGIAPSGLFWTIPIPGDAIDVRAAVLLCWLRHVSANLEKSTRYARHYLWLRANVLSVLDRVA